LLYYYICSCSFSLTFGLFNDTVSASDRKRSGYDQLSVLSGHSLGVTEESNGNPSEVCRYRVPEQHSRHWVSRKRQADVLGVQDERDTLYLQNNN